MSTKDKKGNLKKFEIRGTIKEIMRNRGLRAINVANYNRWLNGNSGKNIGWLHSIKLNLMDGYMYLYGFDEKHPNLKTSGNIIEDAPLSAYESAYKMVKSILKNEDDIPSKVKRNILVKISR